MTQQTHKTRVAGVDADLDMLFNRVGELRELASDPERPPDGGRVYDFRVRWGIAIAGRLERLAHYHARGRLAPDERVRYEALRARLREALPLMDRLPVPRPRVPLVR
ncbi:MULTISPECIES: hypothetical protein [unclassified Microbispora]|uniref:hypothetical protein n=1 Tax=unclassified Microbispora TaxID=2614687 RepID=UPI0014766C87|nr:MULTISPECIES: hypothetical protein [unclassified Microbispora]